MKFTHIRHGSHIIKYKNKTFLVDPVFADKGSMSSMPKARTKEKNPLLPMPFSFDFIKDLDGVLITHTHFDHFDDKAIEILPKDLPIFCRKPDKKKIEKNGFSNITLVDDDRIIFDDIKVTTFSGKHGIGLEGFLMGKTTGFFLSDTTNQEPKVFITGDTIWFDNLNNRLKKEKPDLIIAFAGAAVLPFGKNITMATRDIDQLAKNSGEAKIIAIHMDAWSHYFLTKDILNDFIKDL